jgi:uncharacterized protein
LANCYAKCARASGTDDLPRNIGPREIDSPRTRTDALADWPDTNTSTPWLTSTLAKIELPRALRRTNPHFLSLVPPTVARLARDDIDEVVRAAAAAYPDPGLRAPDAIHFATAQSVFGSQLTNFVNYDERPQDALQR